MEIYNILGQLVYNSNINIRVTRKLKFANEIYFFI